ncbi:hypothetical protein AcV7_006384 [Taiwanofungus camphoratus]|nr:hypothetical protein AcV7_006384 [Antrodia cinnamomea]
MVAVTSPSIVRHTNPSVMQKTFTPCAKHSTWKNRACLCGKCIAHRCDGKVVLTAYWSHLLGATRVCQYIPKLRLLIAKSIVLRIILIDVGETYGADALSGVLYVGGAPLSLKSAPPTFPQTFLPLLDAIVSTDATVAAKTAAWFVDSCVAHPKLDLPWPRKLQWMGSFGSQPPQIRQYMMTRTQNEARWLAEASM